MPSIRIKDSAYSALDESNTSASPAHRRRALTVFFPSNAPPVTGDASHSQTTVSPRIHRSLPTLRGQRPISPQEPPPLTRPRSGTVRSQIRAYRTTSSRRHTRASQAGSETSAEGPSSPPLHKSPSVPVTLEGPQVDVVVPSAGDHGVIGSTFSLAGSEYSISDHLLPDGHHDDEVVEHLDVIDPQVGTVSSLTNAANALPPLSFYSRKPVLVLKGTSPSVMTSDPELESHKEKHLQDYLDRHVDDVLRRPSKFRRTMKGIWSFLKTPMGIITGIYGFLVVFWGAAIVIFVAKIINFHNPNTQGFWVEVASQTENGITLKKFSYRWNQAILGLFTATGIGLIPYRVFDTYRIFWIWHYKRKTRKLRAKAGLPQLFDDDDLPDPKYDPNYIHVLTANEEKFLYRQQRKFRYSQTWYRPHGTETHRAFPINTALLICLFNDGNSIFQIMLCGTMWGLDRFQRPAWSTGILIPCSFLCGILAAVFIWRGGQKTKRVAEVEERLRAALLAESGSQTRDSNSHSNVKERHLQENEMMVDEHMIVPPVAGVARPASD